MKHKSKNPNRGIGVERVVITNSPDNELFKRLSPVKSNLPVSIAFGNRFEFQRPGGMILNPDSAVTLTHRPDELFQAIGKEFCMPYRTAKDVASFYGALRALINISDGAPIRYMDEDETFDINNIGDFSKIAESDRGFAASGIFTAGSPQVMKIAVAPALFHKGKKESLVPLNGLSYDAVTDEVFETIQKATAKLQLDYLVLTMMTTKATGARVADVKSDLVEPALKMVDAMIAQRLQGK